MPLVNLAGRTVRTEHICSIASSSNSDPDGAVSTYQLRLSNGQNMKLSQHELDYLLDLMGDDYDANYEPEEE